MLGSLCKSSDLASDSRRRLPCRLVLLRSTWWGVADLGSEDDSCLVAAEGGLATLSAGKTVAPLARFVKLVLHGTGAVGGPKQILVGLLSLLSRCGQSEGKQRQSDRAVGERLGTCGSSELPVAHSWSYRSNNPICARTRPSRHLPSVLSFPRRTHGTMCDGRSAV